ncbi:MAG: type I secretion system permease/ATPase [Hyphomicrobium sp.]
MALLLFGASIVLALLGVLMVAHRRSRNGRKPHAAGARPAAPEVAGAVARSELKDALRSCRTAFIGIAAFSLIINVLMLTASIFMLEVYDRVLPSRSVPTLIALTVIAGILFAALGLLDIIRSRLLLRAGSAIDEAMDARVFDAMVRLPMRAGNGNDLQPIRDLDAIRGFLSSQGPTALFDMPWLPFYLALVYAFHPLLGLTALIGAIILVALTVTTEVMTRRPSREATAHSAARINLAQACVRNAEVLAGMGFASRLGAIWASHNERALESQRRSGDIAGGLGAAARVLRMVLQSAVLAVGAYLVIMAQASPGIIIAGSILAGRALAPVDIAIANWKNFMAARQGWTRLEQLLAKLPSVARPMALPAPKSRLHAEGLAVAPPGDQRPVVRDVAITLNAGQGLGIIGPSGAGKSSLARALVGAWLPMSGSVRLDGAALDQWAPESLGRHIGYLPQSVELFSGSVAQNIARFDPQLDPQAVIEAAGAADLHDLIVSLPNGYETDIGDGGSKLSAGQRQRLGLARALYGKPFLVVLDEPDAALDRDGEQALQKAILGVRERGGTVVVVSHRDAVLSAVDLLLVLERGRPMVAGPKELVLQKLAKAAAPAVHALK